MSSLPVLTAVFLLCLLVMLAGRRSGAILYMSVPVALISYFVLSTEVFDFGYNVPIYPYHGGERHLYLSTLTLIGLFFLSAYAGKRFACFLIPPVAAGTLANRLGAGAGQASSVGRNSSRQGTPAEAAKLILALLPTVFVLAAAPLDDIIDRDSFNANYTWQRAMVFADTLFWFSALAIPTIRNRSLKYVCLTILVVSFASLGERQAPVALLLFVVIDRFVIGNKNVLLHGLLGAFSAWLLVVLISLRPDSLGGMVQVAARVANPEQIPFEAVSYAFNYMTNFSIIVNSIAIEYFPVDAESFRYGISILPSFIYDDTDNYILRNSILPYVPFPGFAFLVSYFGPAGLMIAAVLVCFFIELYRNMFVHNRDSLENLLYGALVIIPVLFSLQYNLRACSRLFYVLLFLYVAVTILRRIKLRAPG